MNNSASIHSNSNLINRLTIRKNLRRFGLVALLGAASFLPLSAATLGVDQNHFTMNVPDNWTVKQGNDKVSATCGTTEAVSIFVAPVANQGPMTADSPYVKGFMTEAVKRGIYSWGTQKFEVNGVPYFVEFLVQPTDAGMMQTMVFFTATQDRIYQIGFVALGANPIDNTDYQKAIESFNLAS